MKKISNTLAGVTVVGAILLASMPITGQAQVRAEMRADMQMERQENREERKEFRQDRKEQLPDIRQLEGNAKAETQKALKLERAVIRSDIEAANMARKENVKVRKLDIKERIKEKTADYKVRISSDKDAVRATFTENKKSRVLSFTTKMFNRFEAAAESLVSISTRIEDRIIIIKDNGGSTAEAEAALAKANISIETAITDITAAEATIKTSVENEDEISKDGMMEIVATAKNSVKLANTDLKAAVESLKKVRATITISTETE